MVHIPKLERLVQELLPEDIKHKHFYHKVYELAILYYRGEHAGLDPKPCDAPYIANHIKEVYKNVI